MGRYTDLGHDSGCRVCIYRRRFLAYLDSPSLGRFARLLESSSEFLVSEDELRGRLRDLTKCRGRRRRKAWRQFIREVNDVDQREKERYPSFVRLVEAFRKVSPFYPRNITGVRS